jgi:hypothetical protein
MDKTQTHILTRIVLDPEDGASVVDFPANPHAEILLAKGGGVQIAPAEAYRRLCDHAAQMVSRVAKGADGQLLTQEQCFARLLESRDPVIREFANIAKGHGISLRAHPPADENYEVLMARATEMSKRSGRTVAVEFAQLYEKRNQPIHDTEADPDGDLDDADSVGELGPPRNASSTRQNPQRSSGVYETSGVNISTNSPMAPTGAVQGSYDPRGRPDAATKPPNVPVREGGDPRYEKRLRRAKRLIDKGFSAGEAVRIAMAPKAVRKALRVRLQHSA